MCNNIEGNLRNSLPSVGIFLSRYISNNWLKTWVPTLLLLRDQFLFIVILVKILVFFFFFFNLFKKTALHWYVLLSEYILLKVLLCLVFSPKNNTSALFEYPASMSVAFDSFPICVGWIVFSISYSPFPLLLQNLVIKHLKIRDHQDSLFPS